MTPGLAVLVLATQLTAFLHLAFVPHVTCAEHGELIEPGRPPALSGAHRPAEAGPALQGDAAAASVASVHAHDHCIVTAAQRTPARLQHSPLAIDANPHGQVPVGVQPVRCAPPGLPPLAVAPKSSPPAT